jgi:uncharacterized protein (TIGR00297 family)
VIERALAGFVLAGAIAFVARTVRVLSLGGAVTALLVGTAAAIAGWTWATLLIVFFVTSSALSRFKHAAREARIGGIVEKGNERDAVQVLANGGVFAGAALLATATSEPAWAAAALGALAAATADTWATEVGTVAGGSPRSIITLRPLPAGTSGAITVSGTLASIVGAAFIASVSYLMGFGRVSAAVFVGGVLGSLADSLMGGTIQERRWCDGCSEATERRTHYCGRATRVVGGVPGARNDFVNVVCTLVGAVVAAALAR